MAVAVCFMPTLAYSARRVSFDERALHTTRCVCGRMGVVRLILSTLRTSYEDIGQLGQDEPASG